MLTDEIKSYSAEWQDSGGLFLKADKRLRIRFVSPSIVRVTYTEGRDFIDRRSRIVVKEPERVAVSNRETEHSFRCSSCMLRIEIDKQTGALSYWRADDELLIREPKGGGKWLAPKEVYRNVFPENTDAVIEESIDGVRAAAGEYARLFDRMAFEAKLTFDFAENEALFGLGSHEEGYANLRGKSRDLYQQNMKAVVPFLVSTRGYGVLMDCGSAMRFHDGVEGAWWWLDCVEELDFYVITGAEYEDVHRGYHTLTGAAPMLPKWALGYIQSKERYVTGAELVEVVSEYRRRRVPLDMIVLDWKSWSDGGGWGQKELDPVRFPRPEFMIAELHAMGAKLMMSIWPLMTGGCSNQQELLERGLMLGNRSTYNAFLPEARKRYWEQARQGLFHFGVDAWWCDCTEPFEADWAGALKPGAAERFALNIGTAMKYLDPEDLNMYSLLHSQGIYEGQRTATAAKRVLNLTRSSYAGQHRYGTVTWNGDVCATWETLRRSIPEGVNFCAAGEPYWTVDIGGFFIDSRSDLWFWRGDYHEGCRGLTAMEAQQPDESDTGCRDLGYWELYVRWLQYASFLPMFRSHGTDAAREIWRFGEAGTPFYDAILDFIRLRYRLTPYLYSLMAQVSRDRKPMLRGIALQFPQDEMTHDIANQFLLGTALMVCPVTEPMYFEANSIPLDGSTRLRDVYLPAGNRWYDYWTDELLEGGQSIAADAPLERIPLYVRAGSIVPFTEVMQYMDEVPTAAYEIRVYTGCDAEFVIYEDKGDGYDYESGAFAQVRMRWSEEAQELLIESREGSFPEMVLERIYKVVFLADRQREEQMVTYRGTEMRLRKTSSRWEGA